MYYHHHHHHHQFVVLFVGAEVETVCSGFTLKLRHRGRSLEARDQSLLFLSYCLSFFLSLYLLSCGSSSSSLIGAVQSADSPFMADGGKGAGLLECWHVPIRATVLHYSISGSELLQGLQGGL